MQTVPTRPPPSEGAGGPRRALGRFWGYSFSFWGASQQGVGDCPPHGPVAAPPPRARCGGGAGAGPSLQWHHLRPSDRFFFLFSTSFVFVLFCFLLPYKDVGFPPRGELGVRGGRASPGGPPCVCATPPTLASPGRPFREQTVPADGGRARGRSEFPLLWRGRIGAKAPAGGAWRAGSIQAHPVLAFGP